VVRHALDAGFARSASEDLALGVTEVATNSVVHGGAVA
jgi:anti-sigma regulatory factor (Ser/Thr protein kinase)